MPPTPPAAVPFDYRCVCGGSMTIGAIFSGRMVVCSRCATPVIAPLASGATATELQPSLSMETKRLRLEPAVRDDWNRLLPITSAPENYDYEVSDPDTARGLRRALAQSRFPAGFRKSLSLRFVATRRDGETDAPIGLVHLQLERNHLTGTLGIMIHHPHQGMGFGGECVEALNRFCFETLRLFRLSAGCDPENKACASLLRSAGFEQEGRLRNWMFHSDRGWIDCLLFAKLSEDAPRSAVG